MEELLRVKRLSLHQQIRQGAAELVQDVSFPLYAGRPLILIGESGCGKSLVGQAVLGIIQQNMEAEGEIRYKDIDLLGNRDRVRTLWGRDLFLFPQEPGRYLNPLIRSLSQVAEIFRWIIKEDTRTAQKRSAELMKKFNLEGADLKKYPWQLSGGMGQRLLASISLAVPARVIVADEPTKGLDGEMKQQTASMLKQVADSGKALLVITHDLDLPIAIGGDIAVMYGGQIVEYGPVDTLLDNPVHPYTVALYAAMPENGLQPIARQVNEDKAGIGCVFASRCTEAITLCFTSPPPALAPVFGKHSVACYQKSVCPVDKCNESH